MKHGLRISISTVYTCIMMLFVVGMYNQVIWNQFSWWNLILVAFFSISIVNLLFNHEFKIKKANLGYICWVLALCAMILLSCLWSVDRNTSMLSFHNFWRVGLYVTLILVNIKNERDVRNVVLANWIAGIVITIYLIVNFDVKELILVEDQYANSTRLGLGGIEHPNVTAYNLFLSYACGFYLLYRTKGIKKVLLILMQAFLVAGELMTGSRKVLITIILIPVIYMIAQSKNPFKLAGKIGITLLIVHFAYGLTQSNPLLYNLIGYRIESISNIIYGADESAGGRQLLVLEGIQVGLENPFGVGLNCLKHFTSDGTYAHNEYVEIFADLGVLGFLVYYIPIFGIAIRTFRNCIHCYKSRNIDEYNHSIFWLAMIICILVLSFYQVTFAFYSYHIMLGLYLSNIHLYSKVVVTSSTSKEAGCT